MSKMNISGVKLPASDLADMIAGGSLQNTEGWAYLEDFLKKMHGENVIILPLEEFERILEERRQMHEILESERQLLTSYGLQLHTDGN